MKWNERINWWLVSFDKTSKNQINQSKRKRRNSNKREKKQIKASLKFISDFSHFSFSSFFNLILNWFYKQVISNQLLPMSDLFPSPNRIQSINQMKWNEKSKKWSIITTINWMNPIIKSQPPKLMLDLFCLLLIQFNQSIKWKKERKKEQQTNQPTIYFIVICSFISIQFNSRKEKKWLKQTIKRTITKHQSFLIHLTNLINQSINHQNERVMKWDLSNFSFPTNPSSKCLNFNFETKPSLNSINQSMKLKERVILIWFCFFPTWCWFSFSI